MLPRLADEYGASVSRQVLKSMQLAGDAADCIDQLAADWAGEPPFEQLPVAVQRQVVQRQLFALGDAPSFDLVEALRLEAGHVIGDALALGRVAAGLQMAPRGIELALQLGSAPGLRRRRTAARARPPERRTPRSLRRHSPRRRSSQTPRSGPGRP